MKEGSHLGKMFISTLLITGIVIGVAYSFAGFEIALLFAVTWLAAVVATAAVGIENIIIQTRKKD